jgi:chorismate mutase
MDIREWRDRIDEIDRKLVELLNRRAACVLEIGRLKRALRMPVYEPAREEEIFANISEANQGPLPGPALRRVFERVIDEGRSIQRGPMEAPTAEPGEAVDTELNQSDKD